MIETRLLCVCLASLLVTPFALGASGNGIPDMSKGRIIFLGDSITQAGEYVSFVEYALNCTYPKLSFDIVSIGLASETVSGLTESVHPFPRPCVHDRLWAALDVVKPKTVFACYGINDGIYHPLSEDRFKAFKDGILKLIAIDKAAGAKTILITPPPFDPVAAGSSVRPGNAPDFSYMNVYEHYDDVVAEYGRWEMSLSGPDVQVIDVHSPLVDLMVSMRKDDPTFKLSDDGVHINELGHWTMAKAILKSLGFSNTSISALGPPHYSSLFGREPEYEKIKSDPIFPLVDKLRKLRSEAWLPFVGYVRGTAFKTISVDEAEKEPAKIQAQIDKLRKYA